MISKSYNVNSDFVPVSTVSQKREPIPYICGLGARVGYERVYANIQTAATKVTNIGDRLSFLASVSQPYKSEYIQIFAINHITFIASLSYLVKNSFIPPCHFRCKILTVILNIHMINTVVGYEKLWIGFFCNLGEVCA